MPAKNCAPGVFVVLITVAVGLIPLGSGFASIAESAPSKPKKLYAKLVDSNPIGKATSVAAESSTLGDGSITYL